MPIRVSVWFRLFGWGYYTATQSDCLDRYGVKVTKLNLNVQIIAMQYD